MRHNPLHNGAFFRTTALAGLIALGASSAMAQAVAPTGPALNFGEVSAAVQKQGYQDIREIERKSDKLYEIEARDSAGAKVELYVDARTGEVLKIENKSKGRNR